MTRPQKRKHQEVKEVKTGPTQWCEFRPVECDGNCCYAKKQSPR